MNINQFINIIVKPFRQKRMARFLTTIEPQPTDKILDVGGTDFNWNLIDYKHDVVLLNIHEPENKGREVPSNFSFTIGDGTDLKYADGEFDICFSNSVIEHVGSLEKQQKFAREICRVGKKIWIQTPAKSFFFEPHFITPFIHWFPKESQKKLARYFTLWGWIARPSQEYIDEFVDQTRLMTYEELKNIFPDCTILKEKFLFATKSYLIIKEDPAN
jgi:ubiquinone/menaquinone biosynthesis C-methylase UbiE